MFEKFEKWSINIQYYVHTKVNLFGLYNNIYMDWVHTTYFNPIQDAGVGEEKGPSPYHVSPVTSTNVGISHQNSLTCSFNPFATLA